MTAASGAGDGRGGGSEIADSVAATVEGLRESATVTRSYGDPVSDHDRTVIPVARVAYGFGGGFGSGYESTGDAAAGVDDAPAAAGHTEGETHREGGQGGGGGGGVVSQPIGVVELTDEGTRFIRFTDWKRLLVAVGFGVLLGRLLGRR